MKVVYPGTFNPFTIGHKYVLDQTCRMFGGENVTILLAENTEKDQGYFKSRKRHIVPVHNNVDCYKGLTTGYCFKNEIELIVRGVRNQSDFQNEYNMSSWNNELSDNDVKTILIPCPPKLQNISSSAIRTLYDCDVDVKKYFCNDYSYHRWTVKEPKYKIYFGKMAVGKSSLLSGEKYVDFDKFIYSQFSVEEESRYRELFSDAIRKRDHTQYNFAIDSMSLNIDKVKLFKDAFKISNTFEISAIGSWFDEIPIGIIRDAEIIKVECSEEERVNRAIKRGISMEDFENFNSFYKDPPFWDRTIVSE